MTGAYNGNEREKMTRLVEKEIEWGFSPNHANKLALYFQGCAEGGAVPDLEKVEEWLDVSAAAGLPVRHLVDLPPLPDDVMWWRLPDGVRQR